MDQIYRHWQLASYLAGRGCTWAGPAAPGTCLLTACTDTFSVTEHKALRCSTASSSMREARGSGTYRTRVRRVPSASAMGVKTCPSQSSDPYLSSQPRLPTAHASFDSPQYALHVRILARSRSLIDLQTCVCHPKPQLTLTSALSCPPSLTRYVNACVDGRCVHLLSRRCMSLRCRKIPCRARMGGTCWGHFRRCPPAHRTLHRDPKTSKWALLICRG